MRFVLKYPYSKGATMGYLYETHCHTARTSACSLLSPEDIVELYVKNGYKGVFITDHFLNGNTTVHRDHPSASYQEQIEYFFEGFEQVKKAAGDKLDVFFGFEDSYLGTDILVYGWNKEQLKTMSDIMDLSMRDFARYCKENGAIAVQAHPFREDFYIDHIRLYPDCEGVEVYNAGRNELCNSLGRFYAESYGKIMTSGSDLHRTTQPMLGGMEFDEPIVSETHFVELLRSGKGKLIQKKNALISEK